MKRIFSAALVLALMPRPAAANDIETIHALGTWLETQGSHVRYDESNRHLSLTVEPTATGSAEEAAERVCFLASMTYSWAAPWTVSVYLPNHREPDATCEIR